VRTMVSAVSTCAILTGVAHTNVCAQAAGHGLGLDVECEGCEVSVVEELVITGPFVDAPAFFGDLGGFYGFVSVNDRATLFLLNLDGTIRTELRRSGDGPGDFRRISSIHRYSEDRLIVLDEGLSRATVLILPDLQAESTTRLSAIPTGPNSVVITDSALLVNGSSPSARHFGYPAHVVDLRSGDVINSIGSDEVSRRTGLGVPSISTLISPSAVVLMPRREYRLETWGLDGRRMASYDLDRSWMDGWDPGRSAIVDLAARPHGGLVVAARHPDPRWNPTSTADAFEALNERLDGTIEVTDRAYGSVARIRSDHPIAALLSNDRFAVYRSGPTGEVCLGVYRLLIRRK